MLDNVETGLNNQGVLELEAVDQSNPTLEHPDANNDDYNQMDPKTAEVGIWIVTTLMGLSILCFAIAACHKLWTCLVKPAQKSDLETSLL
ncbi:MAG: hypothetical protein WBJ81_00135 [Rickettsiales bacterium]